MIVQISRLCRADLFHNMTEITKSEPASALPLDADMRAFGGLPKHRPEGERY
jgi:hypothetical protein